MTFSRRRLLASTASGAGYLAFGGLPTVVAEKEKHAGPLAPKPPHFPAKAKRVIFLCMDGGPSHVDTFDSKPKLSADDGKEMGTGRAVHGQAARLAVEVPSSTARAGCGISELFPEVARHADDLCVINSMQTDLPNHTQAFLQMHTGVFQFPRPSLGAWTLYGLGTENEKVPGFITLCPPVNHGGAPTTAARSCRRSSRAPASAPPASASPTRP